MVAVHIKTFLRKHGNIKSHSAICVFFSEVKIKFKKLSGPSVIHEKCISRESFLKSLS